MQSPRLFRPLTAALCLSLVLSSAVSRASDFKVGVSIPLTGAFAEYGAAVRNGIELALSEHPDKFTKLRFIYEDDQYQPKLSLTALNKFVEIDKVNLLFVWGNEPALAVAPVSERRRIPTVVVAQHPKAAVGYSQVIRFINPARDFSAVLLAYLRHKGLRRFLALKTEVSFFNILLEEFQKQLGPNEEFEVVENYLPDEADFRSLVLRLKSMRFDALGVYLTSPQLIQFFRQAKELGLAVTAFGPTQFESKAVIDGALGQMEGALYSHLHVEPEFRQRYIEKYRDDCQLAYAANAYEFAKLIADLFATQPELRGEPILATIQAASPRQSVLGPYEFRFDPLVGKFFKFRVAVKEIADGKIHEIEQDGLAP